MGHRCKPCRREYRREWYESVKGTRATRYNQPNPALYLPSTVELAWAAGFLEGDGWFQPQPRVGATQVEWDPIARLVSMFGGAVTHKKPRTATQNHYLEWSVYGARARGVMMTLYPFMSPKRKAQIRASLPVPT